MELILWRHAEAFDASAPDGDMARALTPKGHQQAARMAEWLNARLPQESTILVSPALRAQQTVAPLTRTAKVVARLAPGASCQDLLKAADWPNAKAPVLIVGHQNTLGQLAALLLCGQPQYWHVRKANAWWIVQSDPGDAGSRSLKAVMGPDLLLD